MKASLSVPVIVALAVLVHTDWHVARPTHHRLSLGWDAHWTLCLFGFAAAGWYLARRSPRAPWTAASINAALALLVGQIVEPLLEAAFYDGRLAFEVEPERWLAFGQCLAAAGLAMAARRRVRRREPDLTHLTHLTHPAHLPHLPHLAPGEPTAPIAPAAPAL